MRSSQACPDAKAVSLGGGGCSEGALDWEGLSIAFGLSAGRPFLPSGAGSAYPPCQPALASLLGTCMR